MKLEFYQTHTDYCYRKPPELTLRNKDCIIEKYYQKFDKLKYVLWIVDFKLNHDGVLKYYINKKDDSLLKNYVLDNTNPLEIEDVYKYNTYVSLKEVESLLEFFTPFRGFIHLYGRKDSKMCTNALTSTPFIFVHQRCNKIGDCDAVIRVYFPTDYYTKGSKKSPKILQRIRYYKSKKNPSRAPRLSKPCVRYRLNDKFHSIKFTQHFYNSLCQKR